MDQQNQYTPYTPSDQNQPQGSGQGLSIASLVLGIVGFVAWCLPLVGYPVTITGLVLGIVAKNKGAKGMAVAGIILSSITLVLTLINSVLGALINVAALM